MLFGIKANLLKLDNPAVINLFQKSFALALEQFSTRPTDLDLSSQNKIDFLRSATTGHVYAYMTHPELHQIAPLLNMEGSEAIVDGDLSEGDPNILKNLLNDNRNYFLSLNQNQKQESKTRLKKFGQAIVMYFISSMDRFQSESSKELIEEMKKTLPPWLKLSGKSFINTLEASSSSVELRDFQTATNLVAQNKNGIYFVGRQHLVPLSYNLEKLCHSEQNRNDKPNNKYKGNYGSFYDNQMRSEF